MIWPDYLNTNWDDFGDMKRLQKATNCLFYGYREEADGLGAVSAWKDDDEVIVSMLLPGVQKEDIKIEVQSDKVQIKGNRKEHKVEPSAVCRLAERGSGKFFRLLRLPYQVDPEKTKALFRLGVLTLTLRRLDGTKPQAIKINTG